MEIGLIVLAIMLATLLGWLLKQSFNTQPWIAEEVGETAHHGPLGGDSNTKLIALMTLLAVVASFFALVLSAYALRMDYGDWVPLTEPQLLWLNTGVLVLASIMFQWTRNAADRGDMQLESGESGGAYVPAILRNQNASMASAWSWPDLAMAMCEEIKSRQVSRSACAA